MDELQWHLDRQKGIGGSDASTVLCINPWKSRLQLYHEKVDEIKQENIITDNVRFDLGHILKPYIAKKYTEKTGRLLIEIDPSLPPKSHLDYPFMLANIDRGIIKSERPTPGILEMKTKGAFIDWHGEDIPPYYHSQIQHYMSVYNYQWGSFAVLDFNKFEITVTDVERDNDFIENLIIEESKFWDLVQNKTPPEIESTKACSDWFKDYYSESEPVIIDLSNNEQATILADTLKEIKASKKELDEIELQAKTFFMNELKEAEKAIGDGYIITWKNDKDSTKFNVDKFKQEHKELYKKYLEPKKGSRRFLSKFDKR